MEEYIKKSAVVAEIERLKNTSLEYGYNTMQKILADSGKDLSLGQLQYFIDTLEVEEVDLDKQAEWIANGIMIAVQSAKMHTNVYNPDRRDYDHSHLILAARRGIELGLRIAQKG